MLCAIRQTSYTISFIISLASVEPKYGQSEIERLITAYPGQRVEGLRAKTILLVRSS